MIKKLFFLLLAIGFYSATQAQSFKPSSEVGVFLGTSYYMGDLNENHFSQAQPALGLMYRRNFNRRFTLKASAWKGELRGNDKLNNVDTAKINRNLHFKSPVVELSGQVEFNFLPYETGSQKYPFSPFIFTGISFYQFNPQAREFDTQNPFDNDGVGTSNEWVELQPLGTEGQHSTHYPEKDSYLLQQFAIPLGVGFKLSLGEKFSMVAEYGVRKTFTDYLDDVGGTYADPQFLYMENQAAANLSDRTLASQYYMLANPGADITSWTANVGKQRADANNWNDWYVFAGITLSFKIVSTPKVCQY